MMDSALKHHHERLYPFQKEGVEFLTTRKYALLADEVGVGKTPQAVVAARMIQARNVLVICPASIKFDWALRAQAWGYASADTFVVTPKNARNVPNKSEGIFFVNYDLIGRRDIAKHLLTRLWDIVICDESHYLKSVKAQRTKCFFAADGYKSKAKRVWFLTGTPVLNRPEELYTTLRYLTPELLGKYGDYISYTRRYCGGHDGQWGWDATGATNMDELKSRIEGVMLRRERDVLPDLPAKIMRMIHIERTTEIDDLLYQEELAGDDEVKIKSVRHRMGVAKTTACATYIRECLTSEQKIMVFAYHVAVVEQLSKLLADYGALTISGKDSPKQKHEKVRQFIEDSECRVLVAQVDAAGTGIDGLQKVCRHAVFAEISYVPGINQQAMGRLHRNGQVEKTIFDFITVKDSLDENILDKNLFKSEVVQNLTGDSRMIFVFNPQIEGEFSMHTDKVNVTITFNSDLDANKIQKIVNEISTRENINEVKCVVNFDMTPTQSGTAVSEQEVAEAVEEGKKVKKEKVERKKKTVAEIPAQKETLPGVFAETASPFPIEEVVATPAQPVQPIISYEQTIRNVASKIQSVVGKKTPEKINDVLAELNGRIKAKFPQYAHALMIKIPAEQNEVIAVCDQFCKEKGI